MGDWNGWQLLLGAIGVVAALAFLLLGLALRRVRAALARRRGGTASPKRAWHAETVDPVARLRSPYKPEPLCPRCLAINPTGERPFYVCRLNDECGLLEDTPARRR
jgi:hypothetical protein